MPSLLGASFFVLGALIASFMGVVSGRLHTGRSLARGRSHCDACTRTIPGLSLIPVVSYVFQRGRARCCSVRLSPLSPLSEILLGVLYLGAFLLLGPTPALFAALVALALLLALVGYDLAHQILPPVLLYTFVAGCALYAFCVAPTLRDFAQALVLPAGLAAVLAVLHYGSRGRLMGFADIPFVFGLALFVGANAFSGFVFSFWIGAAIGILILLGRPKGSRMGIEVPFAPFLAAGFLLAYFTQWNPFALIAALLTN